MKILGNIIWWIFGGLESAIGYFTGSLALAITIIGIPIAIQTFKIGLLCLWPFGSKVRDTKSPTGCIRIPLNILWLIFGGLWSWIMHVFFGLLLCYGDRNTMGQTALQDGSTIACTIRQGSRIRNIRLRKV